MIFEEIAPSGNEKVVVEWRNGESGEEYKVEADENLEQAIFKLQHIIFLAEDIFVPQSEFEFIYPPKVQQHVDLIKRYTENANLTEFNIMHIIPTLEIAYPHGYYNSRWFELVVYNTETMQCRHIDRLLDGIKTPNSMPVPMKALHVWCGDGSIIIHFAEMVVTPNFDQCTWITVDNSK